MNRIVLWVGVLAFSVAFAQVEITTISYQKVKHGNKIVWQKAKKVVPGSVVRYVNTIKNKSNQKANKLVVTNVIPKHMVYLKSSARCAQPCKIRYSIDGKHFNVPSKLYLKDPKTKKRRLARPNEYQAIEWTIASLDPKKKTTVEYRARLK